MGRLGREGERVKKGHRLASFSLFLIKVGGGGGMISGENRMESTFVDIFSNSLNENRMKNTFVDIFSNSLNENRM